MQKRELELEVRVKTKWWQRDIVVPAHISDAEVMPSLEGEGERLLITITADITENIPRYITE